MRILIVDDHLDGLTALSMLIATLGHEVSTCAESEQCIKCAEDFRPELVLLDLGMSGKTGFDLVPELHKLKFPTFVAALTGYVSPEFRERCAAGGFDYFLAKPASLDDLKALFHTVEARNKPD
jgi:CheY-like chemotaxis protein